MLKIGHAGTGAAPDRRERQELAAALLERMHRYALSRGWSEVGAGSKAEVRAVSYAAFFMDAVGLPIAGAADDKIAGKFHEQLVDAIKKVLNARGKSLIAFFDCLYKVAAADTTPERLNALRDGIGPIFSAWVKSNLEPILKYYSKRVRRSTTQSEL